MRKNYRLTESRLRGIIKESVKNVLNEVKIDYGRSRSSSHDYDWDSNPNNDRGFGYDEEIEYENEIKEDYVAFAQRLEKLTKTEWYIQPSSSYYSSHNKHGYDSFEDRYNETLTFTTQITFNNRVQGAKLLDLIEKIAKAFFAHKSNRSTNEVIVDYDGKVISVVVYGVSYYGGDSVIGGHEHSRRMTYGKDYAGYSKPENSRIKGYNHPYPNPKNDEGNYRLNNWERFMNGEKPQTYDQWRGVDKQRNMYRDEYFEPEPKPWYDDF